MPNFTSRTNNSTSTIKIKASDVKLAVNQLNSHKSIGTDGIHSHVLKECANAIFLTLKHIFQLSLDIGCVPDIWKESIVTPLLKKGNNTDPSNYRPISLTSVACKVLEKIIEREIMSFMTQNKLISDKQNGFVNKKACVTNLLETMDYGTKALASNQPLEILFLDFAKTFDTVPHARLILKLEQG